MPIGKGPEGTHHPLVLPQWRSLQQVSTELFLVACPHEQIGCCAGHGRGHNNHILETAQLILHSMCSVRLADDFGDGPAEEVPTGGSAIAKQPPSPAQDRRAEELVERGTGCSERDAIAAALKDSGGNADKASDACAL